MNWIKNGTIAVLSICFLMACPISATQYHSEFVSCISGFVGGVLLGYLTLKAIFYDEGRA